ncbi:Major allergen Asp f 2 [Penicillium ucsense]|uniref:Major allergen Asp f 2 n=1 Tax=Penicillium ucsense TaxID=2839758 RepID=A0A8J8W163_9EURO|nr:Major allergen Asp f 2 [Penicillium ucsense]KAF7735006.1 Major allergen Asp f 2 [Penicillium ucsense]
MLGIRTVIPLSGCNVTQRRQIELGLAETVLLAAHARDHILRWSNESEIYRKYFGNSPSMEDIGAYEVVVSGDKNGILFRSDNPDGNCDIDGWAGHWRGENDTEQTVICDLSYQARRSLATMCAIGYTVSEFGTNTFWASDLLHRLYHLPSIDQEWVNHHADGYGEVLNLANQHPMLSTHDLATLQYFALEQVARRLIVILTLEVSFIATEAVNFDAMTGESRQASRSTQDVWTFQVTHSHFLSSLLRLTAFEMFGITILSIQPMYQCL